MSEIEQSYFRIELHDPAVPSFCTFPKKLFGTLADIAEVIDCMEQKGVRADTVDAFGRYLEGEQDAEHYVCYNKKKLLQPVEMISMERLEIDEAQWEHTNAWGCIYTMRASHISVTQAVFYDGDRYYRCIRPQFADLQYNGSQGDRWMDIGRCFWGNVGLMTACNDKCKLALFVETQCEKNADAVLSNMGDEKKLDYSRACDEFFGDG